MNPNNYINDPNFENALRSLRLQEEILLRTISETPQESLPCGIPTSDEIELLRVQKEIGEIEQYKSLSGDEKKSIKAVAETRVVKEEEKKLVSKFKGPSPEKKAKHKTYTIGKRSFWDDTRSLLKWMGISLAAVAVPVLVVCIIALIIRGLNAGIGALISIIPHVVKDIWPTFFLIVIVAGAIWLIVQFIRLRFGWHGD